MEKKIVNVFSVKVWKITKKSALISINNEDRKIYVSQRSFNSLMPLLNTFKEGVPCIVVNTFMENINPGMETYLWLMAPQLF